MSWGRQGASRREGGHTLAGRTNAPETSALECDILVRMGGTSEDRYCPGAGATAANRSGLSENRDVWHGAR